MEHHGWISLAPTLLVLGLAVVSRRPIESLLAGVILGLALLEPSRLLSALGDTALRVLTDEDVAWVILVCGLMGSLIGLLVRTGGVAAFTEGLTGRIRSRRQALLSTWGLGLCLFVDDYLNSLALGSSMRSLTDRFRVSREMLAYVVDSTAAPVSVIVPVSTWAVFFSGLIEANGIAGEGEGLRFYVASIPYMLYPWLAVALVPLMAWGRVPLLGPMRAAEARAAEGEPQAPGATAQARGNASIAERPGVQRRLMNFVVPMLTLVAATWYLDVDFLQGLLVSLAVTLTGIALQRSLSLADAFDTALDGFKTMLEPLAVLVAAFMLKEVNDALGLASYVLEGLAPYTTAERLPLLVFLSMAAVSFTTGSSWGVFVIAMPIVVTLGRELDADMALVFGATLSASTFGSHACFYSDSTVLTAQATGTSPFQHALTQLPYAGLAASLAALGYAVLG